MSPQELRFINPTDLYDPAPNGYTHVVIVPTPGMTVYIAGQGGEDKSGNLSNNFVDQLKQAFANLKIALAAVGAGPEHVVKIGLLLLIMTS